MTRVTDPIQIGSVTLKNRITMAPTVKFDFTDDTAVANEKLVQHYAERAAGGCGLICVEATAVEPGGRFCKTHMGLWNEEQMESHKAITAACHKEGVVVIIQLNHTGNTANPECGPAIGPSAIHCSNHRGEYTTIEMSVEEIHEMQAKYVQAAVYAKEAGYDGVQLHGCHGYLINQFMSPKANFRQDVYGGSIENRARFGAEIIKKIRKACGPEFLISIRTSGFEGSVEEAIEVAEEYVKAGCEYLQVSSGIDAWWELENYADSKVTKFQSLGVRFHDHFKGRVPVSCVGDMFTPEAVKYLIENELVDTVDLARSVLADPNYPKAIMEGTPYVKCFQCKGCQYGPGTKHTCPAELVRNKA